MIKATKIFISEMIIRIQGITRSKFLQALGFIVLALLLFAFVLIAIPIGLICALGGAVIVGLVWISGTAYIWFNRGKV